MSFFASASTMLVGTMFTGESRSRPAWPDVRVVRDRLGVERRRVDVHADARPDEVHGQATQAQRNVDSTSK